MPPGPPGTVIVSRWLRPESGATGTIGDEKSSTMRVLVGADQDRSAERRADAGAEDSEGAACAAQEHTAIAIAPINTDAPRISFPSSVRARLGLHRNARETPPPCTAATPAARLPGRVAGVAPHRFTHLDDPRPEGSRYSEESRSARKRGWPLLRTRSAACFRVLFASLRLLTSPAAVVTGLPPSCSMMSPG